MSYLRGFGPPMSRPARAEALRAALGAALGLAITYAALSTVSAAGSPGLIAPFGATAFLVFVVPNSPLAQPWSALLGNTAAALVALTVVHLVPSPFATALAVGLSVLAMAALRALHPPAGAVALLIALNADPATPFWPALGFALSPVALGTAMLVLAALLWNRATGRVYPFRQPPAASTHGTADAAADRRLLPPPQVLQEILARLRLSPNLGPEDLARALAEAEAEATARHLGSHSLAEIMSHDLVTVAPETPATIIGDTFRRHGFNTLPVRQADGTYLGLILDRDLIGADLALTAADLARQVETLTANDGLSRLIPLLADGRQPAVPVLDGDRLVGIVTRSDLVALLARKVLAQETPQ